MKIDVKILPFLVMMMFGVKPNIVLSLVMTSGVMYLCWMLAKALYVRLRVRRIREENRELLAAQTTRLTQEIEKCGQSLEELREVRDLPWAQLVSHLQSGQMRAVTALRAYQAAALEIAGRTNCVTVWLEDAVQKARILDSLPAERRGPLHGVPVSVKDCFHVSGSFSTAGMTVFARKKAELDCPLVETIRKLGGVPFCKTNVPQCMLSLQCSNPIYGTTTNPHSQPGRPRECGGSSGGEGVLVGGGGSVLGLGSDIGGSLRAPVAFCGGYTLRPTAGRHLSKLGSTTCFSALGVQSVGGFMTSSAKALEDCWRIVWSLEEATNSQKADPAIYPLRWDQTLYDKKPRIGYFTSNQLLEAAPGCVRVVRETVQRLQAAGYEVVEINSPDIEQVLYFYNGFVLADERTMLEALSYDVYDSCLYGVIMAITLYKMPGILKKLVINPLIGLLTRMPPIRKLFSTVRDLGEAIRQRDEFVRKYLAFLDSADIDVIICPGQQLPAPPAGKLGTMMAGILPYIPWNVMNFPAGIVPVSTWGQADHQEMENFPRDDILYKMMRSYCEGAEGMPLSVQVVGKPFKDEQVLKVVRVLDTIMEKEK